MIKVKIKNNMAARDLTADISQSPKEIFDSIGINPSGSMVNINGRIIPYDQLGNSFESFDVQDGTVVYLNSVVKADGGNK